MESVPRRSPERKAELDTPCCSELCARCRRSSAALDEIDEILRRLAVDLAAIDKAVTTYRRKMSGEESWTDFEPPA